MEQILNYAPLVLALIMFFMNYKIFVTPADLERKHRDIVNEINPEKRHREILTDVDKKYATKSVVSELQNQIHAMADKVDKIYNILIDRQG
jgi:predicted Holliday junction resolvase-like endonuclease